MTVCVAHEIQRQGLPLQRVQGALPDDLGDLVRAVSGERGGLVLVQKLARFGLGPPHRWQKRQGASDLLTDQPIQHARIDKTGLEGSSPQTRLHAQSDAANVPGETQAPHSAVLAEHEVIASGQSNPLVAQQLKISVRTVEVHRRNIMDKMSIKNTAGLIKFAVEHGVT